MAETSDFDARLRRLDRRRASVLASEGSAAAGGADLGSCPRHRSRRPILRAAAMVAVFILAMKIALAALIGADLYAARLEYLSRGTAVDRASAWLMQLDPLTQSTASFLRRVI